MPIRERTLATFRSNPSLLEVLRKNVLNKFFVVDIRTFRDFENLKNPSHLMGKSVYDQRVYPYFQHFRFSTTTWDRVCQYAEIYEEEEQCPIPFPCFRSIFLDSSSSFTVSVLKKCQNLYRVDGVFVQEGYLEIINSFKRKNVTIAQFLISDSYSATDCERLLFNSVIEDPLYVIKQCLRGSYFKLVRKELPKHDLRNYFGGKNECLEFIQIIGNSRWRCSKKTFDERIRMNSHPQFQNYAKLQDDGSWICTKCGDSYLNVDSSTITKHEKKKSHIYAMNQTTPSDDHGCYLKTLFPLDQIIKYELKKKNLNETITYYAHQREINVVKRSLLLTIHTMIGDTTLKNKELLPLLLAALGLDIKQIPLSYSDTHGTAEQMHCIAEAVERFFVSKIEENEGFYSSSLDKGTLLNRNFTSISIYCPIDGKLAKINLGFVENLITFEDPTGKFGSYKLAQSVLSFLKDRGLDFEKNVSLFGDGAADVQKALRLLEDIKKNYPLLTGHCNNHALELCFGDISNDFSFCLNACQKVYNYFAFSSKRRSLLGGIDVMVPDPNTGINKKRRVRSLQRFLNLTRWSGLLNALEAISNNACALDYYFKKRLTFNIEKKERDEILEIQEEFFTHKILYCIEVLKDLLGQKGLVSSVFQDINSNLSSRLNRITELKEKLLNLKNVIPDLSNIAQYFALLEIDEETPNTYDYLVSNEQGRIQRQHFHIKGDKDEEINDVDELCSRVIDKIISQIEESFPNDRFYKAISILNFQNLKRIWDLSKREIDNFGNEYIKCLFDFFSSAKEPAFDVKIVELEMEWKYFKEFFAAHETFIKKNCPKETDLELFDCISRSSTNKYNNILFMMRMTYLYVFSEAGDEANFSIAKYVLNTYKGGMGLQTLNSILIVRSFFYLYKEKIYEKLLENNILDEALRAWLSKKKRNLRLNSASKKKITELEVIQKGFNLYELTITEKDKKTVNSNN